MLKKLQDRDLIILEQEFKNNPQAITFKKHGQTIILIRII